MTTPEIRSALLQAATHTKPSRIRSYVIIAAVVWSGLVIWSLVTDYQTNREYIRGVALAEARMALDKDLLYRRWAARRGGFYVQESALTPANPNLAHIPERDITTPTGRRLTLVNPAYMNRQVFEEAKEFNGPRGHIASLTPLWEGNKPDPWERQALEEFGRGRKEVSSYTTIDGKPFFRVMRAFIVESPCLKCHAQQGHKVGDISGGISVAIPMEGLIAARHEEQQKIWTFHALFWLLGLAMIGAGGRRIERDTTALAAGHARLLEQNEELTMTEEELRQQVDEYLKTQDELLTEKGILEAVMASMDDCVAIIDRDLCVQYQNRAMHELFGDQMGKLCHKGYFQRDVICTDCPVIKAFGDGMTHKSEMTLNRPAGTVYFESIATPLRNAQGAIIGGLSVLRNVTERRRAAQEVDQLNRTLEERIAERTVQLEAANRELTEEITRRTQAQEEISALNRDLLDRTQLLETTNRELESFSYSVSHDLRAPLRHINSFSAILLEDYLPQLDPQVQSYLHRIGAASSQMGVLIEDLLELSRVTRTQMTFSKVNLSDLADNIATMLQESEPSRGVTFRIEGGLTVRGDLSLLRQLMQNLLDNAWKYTSQEPAAVIEFGSTTSAGMKAFFVRDNGVGFDMQYAHKLFAPFQRLHGKEFDGSGVGLATVYRIVQRHGGKIWAESQPGQGATFFFSI